MVACRVVLGYDGTQDGKAASAAAIALAHREPDCEVFVVCLHERPPDFSNAPFLLGRVGEKEWLEEWRRQTDEDMRHEVTRIRLAGLDATSTCSLDDPVRLLEDAATGQDGRYIVVPDDSHGLLHDLLVGSTARRLKKTSRVPVVAVRADR
jgi:hypothetical protein